jgi:hypothetical protein
MKTKFLLLTTLIIFFYSNGISQSYPTFGPEIKVTIAGLTFDAMEPFISSDGNTLFFNSINSGGNTNLYYANRVNDTTFTYIGMVGGTYDPSPDHLDAVASVDATNNFFWVSLRGYPSPMENLHRGVYSGGSVANITRVYGDFNIYTFNFPFGWLIMDAAINYQGNQLYYCNALFDFDNTTCPGVPCEAKLGVAQKVNDSTFNKLLNSDAIFSSVNDTNYLVYAPNLTKDGLELYYTRLLKSSYDTEICVSVRNTATDPFSLPTVIYSNYGYFPEAPTLTSDQQKMYYHQKDSSLIHKIYLRYRTSTTGIDQPAQAGVLKAFPNPTNNIINIEPVNPNEPFVVSLYDSRRQKIVEIIDRTSIDVSGLPNGIYFLILNQNERFWRTKIVKE